MKIFEHHPSHKEFGEALGTSYHASRRLAQARIVRTIQYPNIQCVHRDDANRIIEEGLTPDERRKLRDYNAEARENAKPRNKAA